VSAWLVDTSTKILEKVTTRRGFLARTAIVGSAIAVNPVDFILKPVSAYAATCNCRGRDCVCGSMCCDGWTEFCCTIIGTNTCPPGTLAAGWWKADGSNYCGGPRYYIDCNVAPGANPCSCDCANGNCNNRAACCTNFRYGQCHQELPTVGAIMCRVVTCTAPWVFDPTCTTAELTDNRTAFHDAACLHRTTNIPTGDDEDVADRFLMRGTGDPKVYLVAPGLGWRWHVPNEARVADIKYVLGLTGGVILKPPAGAKVETVGGSPVWVCDPNFLACIPNAG